MVKYYHRRVGATFATTAETIQIITKTEVTIQITVNMMDCNILKCDSLTYELL